MDSDDEEMCDAASSAPSSPPGGGGGVGEVEAAGGMDDGEGRREGVVIMDVMWFQVDLDYEFDAPRWFDLTQEEAPRDAAAAQEWFAAAPSYPPSPLIAKMLADDLGLQTIRSIADTDALHCSTPSDECSSGVEQKIHRFEERKPRNGALENERQARYRTTMKGTSLRGSTLMKPTASQLAKQNRQAEVKNLTQSKKLVGVRSERSITSSNDDTYQSAKRQRLENGHLNKAAATATQHEYIHKNYERNVMNRNMDRPAGLPRLKVTIPRSPDLATKLRAERSKLRAERSDLATKLRAERSKALRSVPTNPKQSNQRVAPYAPTVQVASTRKVVQPVQATGHQHPCRQHEDVGSNVPACTSHHARHLKSVDNKAEDCRDDLFKFKARPLDRKMLANKGDVGGFQCAKRNTTVPKEFNLSTGRKGNPAPLSELFNKLTLTAGAHQNRGVGRQISDLPNYITTKDCKENIIIGNMHR